MQVFFGWTWSARPMCVRFLIPESIPPLQQGFLLLFAINRPVSWKKNGFRKCPKNDDLLVGEPTGTSPPSLFTLDWPRAWELWVSLRSSWLFLSM
jgi:hypothetical protein